MRPLGRGVRSLVAEGEINVVDLTFIVLTAMHRVLNAGCRLQGRNEHGDHEVVDHNGI